ncbi:MAG TPA: hypothetical protein VE961_20110 [Pyrinomonadaceae bacterium]|nr:hypothetical protein [Pyrinomonadaceae bacterium]
MKEKKIEDIDFKTYSQQKFAALGLNTPRGRKLADDLQDDLDQVIEAMIKPVFKEVVARLNAEGHNLEPSQDGGILSYRDQPIANQTCLRLAFNVEIIAGYGHELEFSRQIKEWVSKKLQDTWKIYIEAIHRFIALNLSVIVGVAAVVSFVASIHKTTEGLAPLYGKRILFGGVFFLVLCLLQLVVIRIWVQQFMDYEVMQPREEVEKYFQGRIHYSWSYRLSEWSYSWQYRTVRIITVAAPITFLAGLILSLLFLYKNLQ